MSAKSKKLAKVNTNTKMTRWKQEARNQVDYVQKSLEQLVAPDYHDPIVFPAPAPSRAGSARYPIVVDFEASATRTDFGIIVKPSLENPISYTVATAKPESKDEYDVEILSEDDVVKSINGVRSGEEINSEINYQADLLLVPITSAGSTFFSAQFVRTSGNVNGFYNLALLTWDGTTLVSLTSQSLSAYAPNPPAIGGLVLAASVTHIGFRTTGVRGTATFGCKISGIVGTLAHGSGQNVMTKAGPNYSTLLSVAKRYRIAAMDATLTYTGAVLENAGVVAVAAVDSSMAAVATPTGCSYYRAITERPFDVYNGRLASEGETEGGAHWFYAPDDVQALSMHSSDVPAEAHFDIPAGIFGVEGMRSDGKFTLTVNIIINFYSEDPQHKMEIQPAIALFNVGLSAIRRHVPLVSSNDSHIKKLKKTISGGANAVGGLLGKSINSGLSYLRDNPEMIAQAALMLL